MKYELPDKLNGYYPEALHLLASLDDSLLFHHEYKLSHPADIFLLTFHDAIESIYKLSHRMNTVALSAQHERSTSKIDFSEFEKEIFNLFFYTSNFIEACQSIIKCFFADGGKGKEKEFTKKMKSFKDNIKNYRDHTSKIINFIKHQHRRIRLFSYSFNQGLIIGYFVEGLPMKNTIGPDPETHPKFEGMCTGISLNRNLPYHLINTFYVASCLASVVKSLVRTEKFTPLTIPDEKVTQCLAEVAQLRRFMLPDEIKMQVPVALGKPQNKFLLEFPSSKKPENCSPHVANIEVDMIMGIKNHSAAPPYFMP